MSDKNNHLEDTTSWTDDSGNEQTEPEYFVYRSKNSNTDLAANDTSTKQFSLGLHGGDKEEEERGETEPELLTDPPEYEEIDLDG